MLKLTMRCARCSKIVEQDVTGDSLNDDMLRKFGFTYMVVNKKMSLICNSCEKGFRELQEKLKEDAYKAECEYFNTCQERKGKDGNIYGTENNGMQ